MWTDTISTIVIGIAFCSVLAIATISGLVALAVLTQDETSVRTGGIAAPIVREHEAGRTAGVRPL
ncbi:MAG: hypothetical protein ACR2PO_15960 [Methyloligellaceae bacterium]